MDSDQDRLNIDMLYVEWNSFANCIFFSRIPITNTSAHNVMHVDVGCSVLVLYDFRFILISWDVFMCMKIAL